MAGSCEEEGKTNIIIFGVADPRRSAADIVAALREQGLLINSVGGQRYRAVTHLQISSKQIDEAGAIFSRVLAHGSC